MMVSEALPILLPLGAGSLGCCSRWPRSRGLQTPTQLREGLAPWAHPPPVEKTLAYMI